MTQGPPLTHLMKSVDYFHPLRRAQTDVSSDGYNTCDVSLRRGHLILMMKDLRKAVAG